MTFTEYQGPALFYREDEDTFLMWKDQTPTPTWKITWNTEEVAWFVDGEFVWMENPFWIYDLAEDLAVGGFLYNEGAE